MKKINLIMWLAGFLVVALGAMAYFQTQELTQQSESEEFDELDRELIDIENELNASY